MTYFTSPLTFLDFLLGEDSLIKGLLISGQVFVTYFLCSVTYRSYFSEISLDKRKMHLSKMSVCVKVFVIFGSFFAV